MDYRDALDLMHTKPEQDYGWSAIRVISTLFLVLILISLGVSNG